MDVIAETAPLAALCARLRSAPFVTVDTEFMRERTYWPKLCLVQIAGGDDAAIIDPLTGDLDLGPLLELMAAPDVLKVFHAARQDIEIFFRLMGVVPAPLFDSQIAAMVCGFGDAAAYETLVAKLARASLDKASRFTDWARRPLSERQLRYALDDVVHLTTVYEKLAQTLDESGRAGWLAEEMAVLSDPAIYAAEPTEAWRRIKIRGSNPRVLGVLREIAAWREAEAQARDMPRNHVVRDQALVEIATHPPKDAAALAHIRGLPRGFAERARGAAVLQAVARGLAMAEEDLPQRDGARPLPSKLGPLVQLLKVLLKAKAESHGVAQKLLANTAELERIAMEENADVPALRGWRQELFGADALALKRGTHALAAGASGVELVPIERQAETRN